jgi:hypothetical protein
MSSCAIVGRQHHATGAALLDSEDTKGPGIVEAAGCECGLPEPCCDHYCSIENCDWMVY